MENNKHQLDEISQAIGRFEAYANEFREGSISITKLIEANEHLSCKRDEELKQDIHLKIDGELVNVRETIGDLSKRVTLISERVTVFENAKMHRAGAISVYTWLSKNWPITAILTFLAGVVAWANDKVF